MKIYDVIVIGAGACGMMSAIKSARDGNSVLVLEKLPKIGAKLKATGGGRCNLTNTLENSDFIDRFGKNGRFMSSALDLLNSKKLREFFTQIGLKSHSPDGYRVFPITHDSSSVIKSLNDEMDRLDIDIKCNQRVIDIKINEIKEVSTKSDIFYSKNIILASGGLGYPSLGADGDGHTISKKLGHNITDLSPAMMPLKTKEDWVSNCRADTIPKVKIVVDIKKYKKLCAIGDLIFTKNGIRGPVVLDFSREITPLLSKFDEVPILLKLTKFNNQEEIREDFKKRLKINPHQDTITLLSSILPKPISLEICKISNINPNLSLSKQNGQDRDRLISTILWTPLTIIGHDGFKMAMITRGGIKLNEINPKTLESKKIKGLYFCGEVVDIDGPCGGYNLQWSFASGYLAGSLTT